MNEVAAQWPGCAAGRRILTDIHAYKKACMRTGFTNFDSFAGERITASRLGIRQIAARINLIEQRCISTTMTQVRERSHRHQQHRVAG